MNTVPKQKAFTLIETIVVIAIVSILVALTLSGVQKVRSSALRAACQNQLRQLGMSCHSHESTARRLPGGCDFRALDEREVNFTNSGISWHTVILPHIEQSALWNSVVQAYRIDPTSYQSSLHYEISRTVLPLYLCPAESRRMSSEIIPNQSEFALTSYLGIEGTSSYRYDGVFHLDFRVRLLDISDGTSQTVMIGERPPRPFGEKSGWYAIWGGSTCSVSQILPAGFEAIYFFPSTGCPRGLKSFAPGRIDDWCSAGHYWSLHPGGANFAYCDGSAKFLRYSAADILPMLATRSGGESIPNLE